MTVNSTNNFDYNAVRADKEDFAIRAAMGVNSAKAVEAVQGISNKEYVKPVEPVSPVSYADTSNVDVSTSTADLGNLSPAMEKLISPPPTPTSSSPTPAQSQESASSSSDEPRSTNSSDYNPADSMRDQVRAMRNIRPPESGESIASNVKNNALSRPSNNEQLREKYGVGSTEGQSDETKVLNRVA